MADRTPKAESSCPALLPPPSPTDLGAGARLPAGRICPLQDKNKKEQMVNPVLHPVDSRQGNWTRPEIALDLIPSPEGR